jgi:hypothetical protein
MELNEIIDIVESISGNALPWKIEDNKNKQLPDDLKYCEIGVSHHPKGKVDLVIINSRDEIPLAQPLLENHGKIYLRCLTQDLRDVLRVAHKSELFWAECRRAGKWSHLVLRPRRAFDQPRWNKEKGSVLLHCDWGWGDTFQFLRYVKEVKDACLGRVILEVRLGLEKLCENLEGVDEVVIKGNPLPEFDYHAELAELGSFFPTVPQPPYFSASRSEWESDKKKFNIGCVWHGHHLTFNFFRFYDPNLLESSCFSKVKYYSLQKKTDSTFSNDDAPMDTPHLSVPSFMEDITSKIENWNDTANLLSQMNLLITTDTAIAHLAGAMNLATWVILPDKKYNTPWLTSISNPHLWYPSTRLFKKNESESWESLFIQVRNSLKEELFKSLV